MEISSIVSIYLDAVTSMVIHSSSLNALLFLKGEADSAEYRLIASLELKIKEGIIQVVPGINYDHTSRPAVTY